VVKENGIDHTMAFMQEGYLFIRNRVKQFHSDLFETRLLGEKVVCMTGEEAAAVFYDPERFIKNGAVPKHIQKTLFGRMPFNVWTVRRISTESSSFFS
jgi:fatty-acid peroxygenase